ncbi:mechanosensitive ion channel family protein [Ponticaulis profundi]|uniref:Mechanosensitive ion channel family protein n=1 Tax=Ponticaulis profundi TaxID=2665222 RepID=A0ABW1SBT9_9PROT
MPSLSEKWDELIGSLAFDHLISALVLIGAIAVGLFIHWLVFKLLSRATRTDSESLLARVFKRMKFVTRIIAIIVAIELVMPLISVPGDWRVGLDRLVLIMLIGTTGWLVNQIVRALTEARLNKYDMDAEDNLEARKVSTRMKVLRQMMTMLIMLVTIAAMLMIFPSVRTVGVSLFASAGVAGIVIGFAARPVLANLLAGIQIALTQPIRIGDAVIMEGEWGWIEEITATYVVVKIWDWRRLIVPLTQIIEKPFQNWTRETSNIIGSAIWHLDYTAPVSKMRDRLSEILDESELWDGEVKVLQVINTSEETMEIRALMSARSSPVAWDLRCEVREKMISWLQKEYPGALPRRRGQLQIDDSKILESFANGDQNGGGEKHPSMSEQIDFPEDRDEAKKKSPPDPA